MKNCMPKRILSGLLAMVLVFSNIPAMSFAAEGEDTCIHHTVHEDCGYAEAVEASECTHEHDENCYETVTACIHVHEGCGYIPADPGTECDHNHSEACGYKEAVPGNECGHNHDAACGYADAVAGTPCDHNHSESCGYAEPVEAVDCDHDHSNCGYVAPVEDIACNHSCTEECAEECTHTCDDGTCAFVEANPGVECPHVCGDGTCAFREASEGADCQHVCGDGTCAYTAGTPARECGHTHDADCGYVAEIPGNDCGHSCENGECAYEAPTAEVPCGHECTEESGCVTSQLACAHQEHDDACGYAEAREAQPCTYDCKICRLQAMIDALPDEVTEDNRQETQAALAAIEAFSEELTAEEYDQVDFEKRETTQILLEQLGPEAPGGVCGENLTWKISDSVLTVSGEGAMYDFVECDAPWYGYAELFDSINMESGVTYIGNYAFTDCEAVNSVSIPETVTEIAYAAFFGCSSLEAVELPESLEKIGESSFGNCTGLSQIIIPDSVTSISCHAFADCPELRVFEFQGNAPEIHSAAFHAVKAQAKYPRDDETWTEDMFRNYGGTITWIPYGCEHSIVTQPSTATCTEAGLSEGSYCELCGKVFAEQVPVDALGHDFEDNICLRCYAPGIVLGQMATREVAGAGERIEVIVPAEGEDLTYAWYFRNAGVGSFRLTTSYRTNVYGLTMDEARDGRQVYCVITDKYGNSVETDIVTLFLQRDLAILEQPLPSMSASGFPVRAFVLAEGTALEYQWYYADVDSEYFAPAIGFNDSEYIVEMNEEVNGRQVYCEITDWEGNTVTTDTVTLTMITELAIITQPESQHVGKGKNAVVSVRAEGEGLTYQWYYRDWYDEEFSLAPAFKGSTYSVRMTEEIDGRQVYCHITDKHGAEVSTDVVTLTMKTPLMILTQPSCEPVAKGDIAEIFVEVQGEGLTFEWYFKNPGATKFSLTTTYTSNVYSVIMKDDRNGRQVYCVITDDDGNSVTTDLVTLTQRTELKITAQPENAKVLADANAVVSVQAQGDGLKYTWWYAEKGSSTFNVDPDFKGGSYTAKMSEEVAGRKVFCIVTDAYGNSVQSDTVTLSMRLPLTITKRLTTAPVANGEIAYATVKAEGEKLSYQWYFKNPGATKFSLTTTYKGNTYSATMKPERNGRQIYCVITDGYGYSVTTDTVTLTMKTPLKITTQPKSVKAGDGGNATVSLVAQGDGLKYTWYYAEKGSNDFIKTDDFKGSSYTAKMSEAVDGRRVYCIVKDEYGASVKSSTVTLSMKTTLAITKQPESVAVCSGETAITKVEVQGDGLTYKWYYKNAGASKFTLTTSYKSHTYSVTMSDARKGRQVYCVITDKYGDTVTTDTVTLNQKTQLKITKQPESVRVASGANAVVSLKAQGDGLTYKWYYANKDTDTFKLTTSFKGSSYTVKMDEARDGRRIYCVITDKYGDSVQTKTVSLSMKASLAIIEQLSTKPVYLGEIAEAKVTAQGEGLSYKWYFKNPGASKFSLTTSYKSNVYTVTMTEARNGRQVYCVITDVNGKSVTTETVTLQLRKELKITAQPVSVRVTEDVDATVSVKAEGDGLTYLWYYSDDGGVTYIADETSTINTYTMRMTAARNGRKVYCKITDEHGEFITSQVATLTMKIPLKITRDLESEPVYSGQIAVASFEVQGEGLTYQWYFQNPDADEFKATATYKSNTYSVTMNPDRDGRQVYCVVTDVDGYTVTTDTVTLRMIKPPVILEQPEEVSVRYGKLAEVSVNADGIGLSYQWYYSDWYMDEFLPIEDAQGSSYAVEMNDRVAGRSVYCVITDRYGEYVVTDTVLLLLKPDLIVDKEPESVFVKDGELARVTVEADGDGLRYQWYYRDIDDRDFEVAPGYTSATYSVVMNESRNGRQVQCYITDDKGNDAWTEIATLYMSGVVQIVRQPESVEVEEEDIAYVDVEALGEGLTYSWYFKNPGASKFSLTNSYTDNYYMVTMEKARNGRQVYCVVTDIHGNQAVSDIATLSMRSEMVILNQPESVSVNKGQIAHVSVDVDGDPVKYEWYFRNSVEESFRLTTSYTGNTYSVTMNEARNGRQVYCVITDSKGCTVKTDVATLYMNDGLYIVSQPTDVAVAEGELAVAKVEAHGEGLQYAWYYRNAGTGSFSRATGFTGNTYSITMNASRDGRQVYCVITDEDGYYIYTDTVTLSMRY